MSETIAASSQYLDLLLREALKATAPSADTPVRIFVSPFATARVAEAREHVRVEDIAEAHRLVDAFVERLRPDRTVAQVWASWEPDFVVTAVVNDSNLEAELRLRTIFIELAATLTDPSRGDLDILLVPNEPEDAELVFAR
jgi:hypothetical protein